MTSSPAEAGEHRTEIRRTGDPAELARAFEARLGGLEGHRRALAAWELARDMLERNLAPPKVEQGACHLGCSWCCRGLEVEIRPAEAVRLAHRARRDQRIEVRVRETAKRVARLDAAGRLKAAVPCAFLDEASGACSVYEDRPLACRSYRSRDAGWCRSILGTSGGVTRNSPVIREALGIRGLIEKALLAVTPAEWQAKGELHRLVVRMLDAVPAGRAAAPTAQGGTVPPLTSHGGAP
jgi:Fe-S-cluster containining protein